MKNLRELLDAYKAGTATEADINGFQEHMYSMHKKQILDDAEAKLGGSITDIQDTIKELETMKTKVDNLPKVRQEYEAKIEEQKKLLTEANNNYADLQGSIDDKIKAKLSEKDGVIEAYRTKVDDLNTAINNGVLERQVKKIARDQLKIDPECVDDFVSDVMLRNLVKMQKGENDIYTPQTIEIAFKENDIPQKKIFTGDEFGIGVVKMYETDPRLQRYFPQVEPSKGGSGAPPNTNQQSDNGGTGSEKQKSVAGEFAARMSSE